MEHSISCTNQAHYHDLIIDGVQHAVDVCQTSSQSIIIPEVDASIPLHMHGAVAYANVRYPTDYYLNNCMHIDVTDVSSKWNPSFFDESNAINSLTFSEDDTIISAMMMDNIIKHWSFQYSINALTKLPNNSYLTVEYLSKL